MTPPDLSGVTLRLRPAAGKTQVWDPVRKKWVILTPEEHVRQYLIHYLVHALHYPMGMLAVEKTIQVGTLQKRYDVIVYDRAHKPWLLAECKAPDVLIAPATLHQLLAYHSVLQCSYWLLTNGVDWHCADARNPQHISWLPSLPVYNG